MTKSPLLFTPGPLSTTDSVKSAMLRDVGSRDAAFLETVRSIRRRLLLLCGPNAEGYEAILMQGSGTFAIESVLSCLPAGARLLILINGAYGRRMLQIAQTHRMEVIPCEIPEREKFRAADVGREGARSKPSHVALVHCETTTGLINPVEEIGAVVRERGCTFIVDAMSSFGGIPLDVGGAGIGFLISSANKCLQGVPGFAFVIAARAALEQCRGSARTVALDLYAQWRGLEENGEFRFTPPTHALLAFEQALVELDAEGGIAARAARYGANQRALVEGMRRLGFETYLPPEDQSAMITTFRYPRIPGFSFPKFYAALAGRGFLIYPGKLTHEDCFRIGTIGRLTVEDVRALLAAIEAVAGIE